MRKNNTYTDSDLTTCKKLSNLIFRYPPSVFLLLFLFSQCQQTKKGCLDVRATNFDVTADKPCTDNCCVYPNIVVEAEYVTDGVKFKADSLYKLPNGDTIKILDIQFYLSDFQLINTSNKAFNVIESTFLYREKDTIQVLNNFTLAGRSNGFSFKLGAFNTIDKFTKLRFKMGLNDTLNKAIPSKMPTSSPLSIKTDSLYNKTTKSYIFNRIVIARGQRLKDTMRLYISTPKDIGITKNINNKEGFDVSIPLIVNYLAFFKDVNFSATENAIKEKIVSNYDKVFQ
jgi:hypothetical protein